MNDGWNQGVQASMTGSALAAVAGLCVATGAVSLVDAAHGWQAILTVISTRTASRCRGPFTIPGWGGGFVLTCTAVALVLLGLTVVAMTRMRRWGQLTACFALVLTCLLWLDAYAVSAAPSYDCDAIGMTGAASAAIDRAGWLFLAAMVLCGLSWAWLSSRINQSPYPNPR